MRATKIIIIINGLVSLVFVCQSVQYNKSSKRIFYSKSNNMCSMLMAWTLYAFNI